MNSLDQHPRLLLAATLLCTFSVLGAIGYHASPDRASAAYMPPATKAEIDAALVKARGAAGSGTSLSAAASEAARITAPAAAAEPAAAVAAKPAKPADAAVAEAAAPKPYTLNTAGPGLLPTAAPGGFVNAEPEPVATPAPRAAASADAGEPARSFRLPGSKRPGSATRR